MAELQHPLRNPTLEGRMADIEKTQVMIFDRLTRLEGEINRIVKAQVHSAREELGREFGALLSAMQTMKKEIEEVKQVNG